MKKLTIEEILIRFNKVHLDKFDYSKFTEYKSIDTPITVICKTHGEFLVTPYDHTKKMCGCPHRDCINEKIKITNTKRYGVEKFTNRDKAKNTCLEKYGVDHPLKNNEIKEKFKTTCLEKYGVENPSFLQEIKEKIGKANSENDAVRGPKRKSTNLEKYGVENPMHNDSIKKLAEENRKISNFKKYGVESPAQVPYILEKIINSSKKFKIYTFPSGETANIQGYESIVLDKLLEAGYTEDDIILKNRPTVKYFWCASDGYGDDKYHIYHPDIFIKSENKIIEVKSCWTYDGNGSRLDWLSKNIAKKNASIRAGYNFEFFIVGYNYERVDI